jgi:hypothetical protein
MDDVVARAIAAARARYGESAWMDLTVREQTRAIYEEMRKIDAENPSSSGVTATRVRKRKRVTGRLPKS